MLRKDFVKQIGCLQRGVLRGKLLGCSEGRGISEKVGGWTKQSILIDGQNEPVYHGESVRHSAGRQILHLVVTCTRRCTN